MSFLKIAKMTPALVLTVLNLCSLSARAHTGDGSVSGGGGDPWEIRFDEITHDIRKWISAGGAQGLVFPVGMTHESYRVAMSRVIAPHAVVVGFVTDAQEARESDPERKVVVNGERKTCRGFLSNRDSMPHVLCNVERFNAAGEAAQYRLVHHEFAGLAGVEANRGASSDYQLSSQITDYLVVERVARLSVMKPAAYLRPLVKCVEKYDGKCQARDFQGTYKLVAHQNEIDACPVAFQVALHGSIVSLTLDSKESVDYGNLEPLEVTRSQYHRDEDSVSWVESKENSIVLAMKTKFDTPANQTLFGLFPNTLHTRWELVPTASGKLQAVQTKKYSSRRHFQVFSNCLYERQ